MIKATFLTREDIEKSDVVRKRRIAELTDFAILAGAECHKNKIKGKENKYTGTYWTKAKIRFYDDVQPLQSDYNEAGKEAQDCSIGGRPVLPYSLICDVCSNKKRTEDGFLEVEFGEYPQTVVDEQLWVELEKEYIFGTLKKLEKDYTMANHAKESVSHREYHKSNKEFHFNYLSEYLYGGKKYVKVPICSFGYDYNLSNGKTYKNGDYAWVEVEPIKWVIDEKKDMAIANNILFSGVPFDFVENYNYEGSYIEWFMDEVFSKEIIPSDLKELNLEEIRKEKSIKVLKEIKKILSENNLNHKDILEVMDTTDIGPIKH